MGNPENCSSTLNYVHDEIDKHKQGLGEIMASCQSNQSTQRHHKIRYNGFIVHHPLCLATSATMKLHTAYQMCVYAGVTSRLIQTNMTSQDPLS